MRYVVMCLLVLAAPARADSPVPPVLQDDGDPPELYGMKSACFTGDAAACIKLARKYDQGDRRMGISPCPQGVAAIYRQACALGDKSFCAPTIHKVLTKLIRDLKREAKRRADGDEGEVEQTIYSTTVYKSAQQEQREADNAYWTIAAAIAQAKELDAAILHPRTDVPACRRSR